ncbi:MAG: NUDIX hydrolase [Pseudomonadota bacterium]
MSLPPKSDDSHLVEHTVDSREVFKGGFLRVVRDTVRLPDGGAAQREFIKHPGAVVVVPILDDGRLVMERQYRYPVKQVMVEFPAGKLDIGEDPLACGKRELLEETGYTAREWARAGAMHLAVGYSDEIIHIWFARGLALTRPQLDEGEFVEVISATPDEFLAWCRDGVVTDAKSLATAAWVQNTMSGTWKLDWRP